MSTNRSRQDRRHSRVHAALRVLGDSPLWQTTDSAAAMLDLDPHDLRQQLRRAPVEMIDGIAVRVVRGGIVLGVKSGSRWLVHVVGPDDILRARRAS